MWSIPILSGWALQSPIVRVTPPKPQPSASFEAWLVAHDAQMDEYRMSLGWLPKNAPVVTAHKPQRAARAVTQGVTKRCAICDKKVSRRATTCGGKCRTALSRRNKALKAKSPS